MFLWKKKPAAADAAGGTKSSRKPEKKAESGRFGRISGFLLKFRPQILCIVTGILLFAAASRYAGDPPDLVNGNRLQRNGYGGRTSHYSVIVEGLEEKPVTLDIPVSPRTYREEELPSIFDACADELSSAILGDNLSASEISADLTLPSTVEKYGIRITWISDHPDLLSSYGTVKNEDLTSPEDVTLKAYLSDAEGKRSELYVFPLTIIPKTLTPEEKLEREFLTFLSEKDAAQSADPELSLPENFNGKTIRYSQKSGQNWYIFLFLGPAAAVLLLLRDRQNTETEEKTRRRQMLLDYPEIVSKFMVFIGAGMTIRLAWESIVEDYETDRKRDPGRFPVHYAYEEMEKALAKLKTGAGEGKVYHDFGRACGLRQYMKFSGILEQNRRTGLSEIRLILGNEMDQAWEERKNTARRLGEEASTKLLGPLFLMLIIVMTMIIVPAMLSF